MSQKILLSGYRKHSLGKRTPPTLSDISNTVFNTAVTILIHILKMTKWRHRRVTQLAIDRNWIQIQVIYFQCLFLTSVYGIYVYFTSPSNSKVNYVIKK